MISTRRSHPAHTSALTDSRLANLGARAILEAFEAYHEGFKAVTRRAARRFVERDWPGLQADADERPDVRARELRAAVEALRALLGDRLDDRSLWASIKAVYSSSMAAREDWEIGETFYNSVTRRLFATVGVDPHIEFVDTDFSRPPTPAPHPIFRSFAPEGTVSGLLERVLASFWPRGDFEDLARDVALAAGRVEEAARALGFPSPPNAVEVLDPVFFRGKGAYLVGRVTWNGGFVPLVLALLNAAEGLIVDAVLTDENDVSILFSFTRSYFHVETERPHDVVLFLKSIIPLKRIAELYIAIGYHKQGKTELYRDLLRHLETSADRFEIAPGERGMVMTVMTLPSYDIVFKIIKDRFDEPKTTTRDEVMAKYRLVFTHDRAGRLLDAQEYEHLQFDRSRFAPELLEELARAASQTVLVEDDHVHIRHLYMERRLTPLNLFLRQADEAAARTAVIDYGYLFKDLASANIFPGDILLKNFGVTRHGRVVSYDYDELSLLSECVFRELPRPRDDEEAWGSEPWFYVGPNDLFPEEFRTFLGLGERWLAVLQQHHPWLFEAAWWRRMQERHRAGEVIHIFPYRPDHHLSDRWRSVEPER